MAKVVGYVKDINGKFIAKSKGKGERVLQNGDPIYENDIVKSATDNPNAKVVIGLSTISKNIELNSNSSLFFDKTVTQGDIDPKDMILSEADVASGLRDVGVGVLSLDRVLQEYGDLNEADFKEGKVENGDGLINSINSMADVNSDLRNVTTHSYNLEHDFDPINPDNNTKTTTTFNIETLRPTAPQPENISINTSTPSIIPNINTTEHTNISIEKASASEDDGIITFTISLSNPIGSDVTFNIELLDNTTQKNLDFDLPSLLNGKISAGETSTTLTIPIKDDYLKENSETFSVKLKEVSPNASIEKSEALGIIKETSEETHTETAQLHLVIADENGNPLEDSDGNYISTSSVAEGNDAKYIVLAFKDGAELKAENVVDSNGSVTINFSDNNALGSSTQTTLDGSEDYNNTSLRVNVGEAFSTNIFDDYIKDSGENFTLSIEDGSFNPTDGTLGYENLTIDTTNVTTTIQDGSIETDGGVAPSDTLYLQLSGDVTIEEQEGGNITHHINLVDKDGNAVNLANGESIDISLNYSDDTTEAEDFSQKLTTVTITGDGGSSYSFTNTIADDYLSEENESYTVSIGSITSSNTSYENITVDTSNNQATATITDDNGTGVEDTVYLELRGNVNVEEKDGEEIVHKISLIDKDRNPVILPSGETITVDFSYSDDTTSDDDFSTKLTSLTLTGDGTTNEFDVINVVTADSNSEGHEEYTISISSIDSSDTSFENIVALSPNQAKGGIDEFAIDEGATFDDTNSEYANLLDNVNVSSITNGKITQITYTDESGDEQTSTLSDDGSGNVTTTVDTIYGTLTVNEDGEWSFIADDSEYNPTNISDVFTYTVEGDSQTATATAGIIVRDTAPTVASVASSSVDEDDLPNGSDGNDSLTVTTSLEVTKSQDSIDTTFDLTEGDSGLTSKGDTVYYYLSDDKHTLTASTATSKDDITDTNTIFTDVINNPDSSSATHTFTLKGVIDHPNSGEDTTTLTFNYKVADSDGDVLTNSFDVDIVDDTPTANSETTLSVVEGQVELTGEIDLLSNDIQGADSATLQSFSYTDENGDSQTGTFGEWENTKYGSLKVNQDGAWEYKSDQSEDNNNTAVTDSFTYTIIDSDGDTSSATQNIDVTDGANPTIYSVDNTQVSEEDLGTGETLTSTYVSGSITIIPGTDDVVDVSFDDSQDALSDLHLTSSDQNIFYYKLTDHEIIAKRADDNEEVFRISLASDGSAYTFTLSLPIDHTQPDHDTSWSLPFSLNVEDSDGDIVNTTFNVDVLDSVPNAENKSITVDEDSGDTIIRLSQDDFGNDGVIKIDNGDGTGYQYVDVDNNINILDPNDSDITIGTLTNNGDGTVTFRPEDNYSNYNRDTNPNFYYKISDNDEDESSANVTIHINPIADAPTISTTNISTTEDNDNTQEGANSISLGLTLPTLNDQTDINGSEIGDSPERAGYIEISFNDGVDGTIIEKSDGTDIFTVGTDTQPLKIYISQDDGSDNTNFHYLGLDSDTDGVVKLTQSEYEDLKIIPSEDNATNIDLDISLTSYEVDDSLYPLDWNINATSTQTLTVDVKAVTDDISLKYDDNQNIGTISSTDDGDSNTDDTNNTFTFNTVDEDSSGTTIDLKSLLTDTSGLENDSSPDLDGSEERWYSFSGLPEGSIITLDGVKTAVASDGTATVKFPDNTADDPDFTLQIAPNYSGSIDSTMTLHVKDSDSDSSVTPTEKTVTLYLKGDVNPVADDVTIQVKQAIGDEDSGRDSDGTINDTSAQNGIPLEIVVTSDDNKDISDGTNTNTKEVYNVTIDNIPDAGSLYVYNTANDNWVIVGKDTSDIGSLDITDNSDGTWKITISDYDNNNIPKFIPPHNDNSDYSFDISAYSSDNGNDSVAQTLTIDVQVKGVADVPINDDLSTISATDDNGDSNTYNYVTTEDSGDINLKAVFSTPADITSYDSDSSESVSFIITNLASNFDISGATFLGGSGESRKWVFTKEALNNDEITLTTPQNYSGEVDFQTSLITTENDGDSKTNIPQNVSVLVTPISEDTLITTESQNEDELKNLDFSINLTDNDETLTTLWIDVNNLPTGVTLKDGDGNTLSADDGDYVTLSGDAINDVWANLDANLAQNYTLSLKYEVTDTTTDTNGNNYSDAVVYDNISYDVSVTPITDTTSTDATAQDSDAIHIDEDNSSKIYLDNTTEDSGMFDVNINITPTDTDGSESATRVVVNGVPVGILAGYKGVDGEFIVGTMSGSTWFIDIPNIELDSDSKTTIITFKITDSLDSDTGTEYPITILTYNQDGSEAQEENSTTTLTFVDNINGDGVDDSLDATIDLKSPTITEDTEFSLNDLITINYDSKDNEGNSHEGAVYTIAISNLTNVSVKEEDLANMQTYDDGNGIVYVVSGTKDTIETNLSNIHLIPDSNYNNNNASSALSTDIKLTAYMPNNSAINSTDSEAYSNNSVEPVTDTITTASDSATIDEDSGTYTFDLNIQSVDNPYYTIQSITIHRSDDYGELKLSDGTTVSFDNNGDATIPVDKITNLQFTPKQDISGSVTFSYTVTSQENNASNEESGTNTYTIDINPVVDGLDLSSLTSNGASGNEDDFIQVVLGNSLDSDGSESVKTILLDNVPNRFLVYVGDDGSQTLALNAGDNGSGDTFDLNGDGEILVNYNTWSIPLNSDGTIPNIWIKAPENWSGDVNDIKLTTVIDDNGLVDTLTNEFDLHVNPIIDDITISPTKTFGNEGEDIPLNLNANVVDLDGSESVTLTLSGFGDEKATFKEDGVAIDSQNITYDSDSDTYTITGIDASKINDVSFVHSGTFSGTINVTAMMVESNGDESTIVSGNFNVDIKESYPSSDDDILLFKGESIDGLDGEDTLVLNGENIDFANIKNIEILDLNAGENSISNLTLDDVVKITDEDNELVIKGDSKDSVTLSSEWGSGSSDGTYTTYTHSSDPTVTLKIEDDIQQ